MKDIEKKATKFLRDLDIIEKHNRDLLIGFDNGTQESLKELMTRFAQQYHQEQLSKLPSAEEAYNRGFDEGAQAAANDILG